MRKSNTNLPEIPEETNKGNGRKIIYKEIMAQKCP